MVDTSIEKLKQMLKVVISWIEKKKRFKPLSSGDKKVE